MCSPVNPPLGLEEMGYLGHAWFIFPHLWWKRGQEGQAHLNLAAGVLIGKGGSLTKECRQVWAGRNNKCSLHLLHWIFLIFRLIYIIAFSLTHLPSLKSWIRLLEQFYGLIVTFSFQAFLEAACSLLSHPLLSAFLYLPVAPFSSLAQGVGLHYPGCILGF